MTEKFRSRFDLGEEHIISIECSIDDRNQLQGTANIKWMFGEKTVPIVDGDFLEYSLIINNNVEIYLLEKMPVLVSYGLRIPMEIENV